MSKNFIYAGIIIGILGIALLIAPYLGFPSVFGVNNGYETLIVLFPALMILHYYQMYRADVKQDWVFRILSGVVGLMFISHLVLSRHLFA